jgi:Arc/MetJ-type ribon-helix-helix transcriptional regulator
MEGTNSQPMTIQLSGSSAEFVRAQIAMGHHSSPAEVIDDLIENLGDEVLHDQLEAELLKGIHSGPAVEVTSDFWNKKRADFVDWYQRTLRK